MSTSEVIEAQQTATIPHDVWHDLDCTPSRTGRNCAIAHHG